MNCFLDKEFQMEEINRVAFDLNLYKASGPDEFTLLLFIIKPGTSLRGTSLKRHLES